MKSRQPPSKKITRRWTGVGIKKTSPKHSKERRDFHKLVFAACCLQIPVVSIAQQPKCNTLEYILASAIADKSDPAIWALTLDPTVIAQLQSKIVEFRKSINSLNGTVNKKRTKQILAYADTVGGLLLIVGGVSFGAPAAFVAGIAFSGAMLITRAALSPEDVTQKDVLTNVAGSRIPEVLNQFGEGATVLSKNAAKYGKAAGAVTQAAFQIYSFYSSAQATNEFQASTQELQQLIEKISAVESEIQNLSQVEHLKEVRKNCVQAIIDDFTPLQNLYCRGLD